MPIATIIKVKMEPKKIFNILFKTGLSKIDPATIIEGIAITIDAISSLIGLSKLLFPEMRLSTLSGVYN